MALFSYTCALKEGTGSFKATFTFISLNLLYVKQTYQQNPCMLLALTLYVTVLAYFPFSEFLLPNIGANSLPSAEQITSFFLSYKNTFYSSHHFFMLTQYAVWCYAVISLKNDRIIYHILSRNNAQLHCSSWHVWSSGELYSCKLHLVLCILDLQTVKNQCIFYCYWKRLIFHCPFSTLVFISKSYM